MRLLSAILYQIEVKVTILNLTLFKVYIAKIALFTQLYTFLQFTLDKSRKIV